MSDRIEGYAHALLAVARAEGNVGAIADELAAVARAVSANEELRSTLSNNLLPASVRNQIVDDILGNRVTDASRGLVGMVVSAGRGGQLTEIIESFRRLAIGGTSGGQVATVRSAVPLSGHEQDRLAKALTNMIGTEVKLETIIDPEVVGGIVTTVGDTVIDGSLRSRLDQMRQSI
ncbi:MAG: ATP synthase F1 subunit delta [Acidimicrobiales bacterium]